MFKLYTRFTKIFKIIYQINNTTIFHLISINNCNKKKITRNVHDCDKNWKKTKEFLSNTRSF